ncbi:MAG: hypothetical protein WCA51_01875 [Dehalococcoidia bacterium]
MLELRVRIAEMLKRSPHPRTATIYNHCGKKSTLISKSTVIFADYIRHDFQNAEPTIQEAHRKSRQSFNLPPQPPKTSNDVVCHLCPNECQLSKGQMGNIHLLRYEYQYDRI